MHGIKCEYRLYCSVNLSLPDKRITCVIARMYYETSKVISPEVLSRPNSTQQKSTTSISVQLNVSIESTKLTVEYENQQFGD